MKKIINTVDEKLIMRYLASDQGRKIIIKTIQGGEK